MLRHISGDEVEMNGEWIAEVDEIEFKCNLYRYVWDSIQIHFFTPSSHTLFLALHPSTPSSLSHIPSYLGWMALVSRGAAAGATLRRYSLIRLRQCSSLSGLEDELTESAERPKIPLPKWAMDPCGREIKVAKARRLGISTSPHKLNLVARLTRGLPVGEAQRQLHGCKKFHSAHVSACIDTAVVNASAFGLRLDRLVVSEAFVSKGKYLKKMRPWHGKGRFGIEEKKYAHLTVIVRELDDELWEHTVMPQYVHMSYKDERRQENQKDYDLDGWTVKSDLDEAFFNTRERVTGLKIAMEK